MWDFFEPEEGRWYRWRLDGAAAFLRKSGEEWRSAFRTIPFQNRFPGAGGPEPCDGPGDLDVSIAVAPGSRVALRPHLGELPYLVAARNDVTVMPGAEARFDIELPPEFRFELEGGTVLARHMPFSLSQAWFGDKTAGTLCLSLPVALDPRCRGERTSGAPASGDSAFRALASCEIVLRNGSRAPIRAKRLAIYSELLDVYDCGGSLATDSAVVDSLADGDLKMGVGRRPEGGRALTGGPKRGISELLVRKGVGFLRSIAGM